MKLFVNGCSHSAGSEIIEKWHPACPSLAYGQHISDYFSAEQYVNLATPGSSNLWIYNSTIEFFEKVDNFSEWFVVIGWTNAGRMPVYCYEKEEPVHLCPNHRNLTCFSRTIQSAYDHLYKTMLPLPTLIAHEHSRIIGMQMFFKQVGIRYMFFDAVSSNHDQMPSKLVDTNRYYRYNEHMNSYWNYYLTDVWDKSERWANHAPASYHSEWANNLIKFIEEGNLLSF